MAEGFGYLGLQDQKMPTYILVAVDVDDRGVPPPAYGPDVGAGLVPWIPPHTDVLPAGRVPVCRQHCGSSREGDVKRTCQLLTNCHQVNGEHGFILPGNCGMAARPASCHYHVVKRRTRGDKRTGLELKSDIMAPYIPRDKILNRL